jgi:F0F1-type ATP synthase membrane subunit b/b'
MVAAAKQEATAILAEARATAEKMTTRARAARDELLPERDSTIEQAALIRSAAKHQVETLREEQQRVDTSIEKHARTVRVVLVESAPRSSSSRSTARSGSSTT